MIAPAEGEFVAQRFCHAGSNHCTEGLVNIAAQRIWTDYVDVPRLRSIEEDPPEWHFPGGSGTTQEG